MSKSPPIHELEFLKLSANHLELGRRLSTLGCPSPDIHEYAKYVCISWFKLGEEHLGEAKVLLAAGCQRASYSRAYYAAYNASKGMRYIASGFVSLKGDDHGKASTEIPGDFPDTAKWAAEISSLYEHRLHADYDNWADTSSQFKLSPVAAVSKAESFLSEVRVYLNTKYGMSL